MLQSSLPLVVKRRPPAINEAAAAASAARAAVSGPKPQRRCCPQLQQQQQQQQQRPRRRRRSVAVAAAIVTETAATPLPPASALSSLWMNKRRHQSKRRAHRAPSGHRDREIVGEVGMGNNSAETAAAQQQPEVAANTGRSSAPRPPMPTPRRRPLPPPSPSSPPSPPAPVCRRRHPPAKSQPLAANNSATPSVKKLAAADQSQSPAAESSPASTAPAAGAAGASTAAASEATGTGERQLLEDEADGEDGEEKSLMGEMSNFDKMNVQFSQRLRSRLNMNLQVRNSKAIEANMHLVRFRQHPTQKLTESERLIDLGISRTEQIRSQKRIVNYLTKARERNAKKKKKTENVMEGETPHYPDWIPFKLRFQRHNSKEVWNAFVDRRKELSKIMGERAPTIVKATEKYDENYIDVWTRSLTVQARPTSILRDLVRPVFSRLGLDNRADFKVSVGCFAGDTRQGGVKIKGMPKTSVEVQTLTPVSALYERGLTEIFVTPWPGLRGQFPEGYFDRPLMEKPKSGNEADDEKGNKKKQKRKATGSGGNKNVSNERLVRWHVHASQMAAHMRWRGESTLAIDGNHQLDHIPGLDHLLIDDEA